MEYRPPAGGRQQTELWYKFKDFLKVFARVLIGRHAAHGCDVGGFHQVFLHDQAELYIRLDWVVETFIVDRIFEVMRTLKGPIYSMNTNLSEP